MTHRVIQVISLACSLVVAAACTEDTNAPENPETGTTTPPALAATATAALSFRQVSAGSNHSCGITSDDLVYCWGLNNTGQLGTGSSTGPESCGSGWNCSTRPFPLAGGLRFRQVSAGSEHTCGVTTENRVYCWGINSSGELGQGSATGPETCGPTTLTPCSTRPVAVAGTRRFRQVSAGSFHTCAVTPLNKPFCWGYNGWGQLGDGSTTQRLTPVAVQIGGRAVAQITSGSAHTCGLTTGNRAYCWGRNTDGQLGDRTNMQRTTPVPVYGGLSFRNLSAGLVHNCAVTTSNRAYCWGGNRLGQTGDGTDYPRRLKPTAVASNVQFKTASAGDQHSCALSTGDRPYCWGGTLGGSTPTLVPGDFLFAQLDASQHSCAVTFGNAAYCWGFNHLGQLGDGTRTDHATPARVVGPA